MATNGKPVHDDTRRFQVGIVIGPVTEKESLKITGDIFAMLYFQEGPGAVMTVSPWEEVEDGGHTDRPRSPGT